MANTVRYLPRQQIVIIRRKLRASPKSMLFQKYVYDLCQKEPNPGPFSRWARFYSESLKRLGRDSKFVKEAVWLRWSAGPLKMMALLAAEKYAEALGRESDKSILFQKEVYNRCQTECTAEEFGYWCGYYSKSLEAIGRDSTFVKRAAWERRSTTPLDISSLFSGENYARALGRTSKESLLFQAQVWRRCLEDGRAGTMFGPGAGSSLNRLQKLGKTRVLLMIILYQSVNSEGRHPSRQS